MNWLTNHLNKHTMGEDTVLSLGIGRGLPDDGVNCKFLLGVDVYEPYLHLIKNKFPVLKQSINDLSNFVDKSFTVVMAIDVLEHLGEKYALKLIDEMERIARRLTIIYTTDGYVEQKLDSKGLDAWGYPNPHQEHQCGFKLDFFRKRDYKADIILPDNNILAYKEIK